MIRDKVNIILTQIKKLMKTKKPSVDGFNKVVVKCLAQPYNQIIKNCC